MALLKLMIDGKNYEQGLKRRRMAAAALLAVGIVGIVCYFLLVPGSDLSEFAQGFYLGGASGITVGALILLARVQYLLKNPEARKKAKIQDTDERERAVIHRAFELAGEITFFAAAAAVFVLLPLSVDAFRAVLGVMVLYCFSWVVAQSVLRRKM